MSKRCECCTESKDLVSCTYDDTPELMFCQAHYKEHMESDAHRDGRHYRILKKGAWDRTGMDAAYVGQTRSADADDDAHEGTCGAWQCDGTAVACENHLGQRCQHENTKGQRDCDFNAVLCIHHGGHDGCAVREMELQRQYDHLRAADIADTWRKATADAHAVIADLLEWAGQMGGWEAPAWERAEQYLADQPEIDDAHPTHEEGR